MAAKLEPGNKIYVKGKGHAEYKGPGEGDGSILVSLNGTAQTMRLDRTEWMPKKEPAMSRTGRPLGHPNATTAFHGQAGATGLGWGGLDSLDEFEAIHSPRTVAGSHPLARVSAALNNSLAL